MEVRVKCKLNTLHLSELDYDLKRDEIKDFTSKEYQKSATLRKAIQQGWVTLLRKALVNQNLGPVEMEKPKASITPKKPVMPKSSKRGRKKKETIVGK